MSALAACIALCTNMWIENVSLNSICHGGTVCPSGLQLAWAASFVLSLLPCGGYLNSSGNLDLLHAVGSKFALSFHGCEFCDDNIVFKVRG